jgi:hypothetical protein
LLGALLVCWPLLPATTWFGAVWADTPSAKPNARIARPAPATPFLTLSFKVAIGSPRNDENSRFLPPDALVCTHFDDAFQRCESVFTKATADADGVVDSKFEDIPTAQAAGRTANHGQISQIQDEGKLKQWS